MASVSALWIGGALGWIEQLCLASFVNEGYEVSLFSYDSSIQIPAGVNLEDASQILPEEMVFENANRPGTYAAFSNIFRYRLLQLRETTWIDSDVLSCGNPLPDGDYLFGWESRKFINGAILRAPKSSPFLENAFSISSSADPGSVQWGQLGPRLVTATAHFTQVTKFAQERKILYPVSYQEVWRLFDPAHTQWAERKLQDSSVVHLWNEVMRGRPVKNMAPPEGSYIAKRATALKMSAGSVEELSLDWVRNTWRKEINPRPFEEGFLERRAGRALRLARRVFSLNR